MGLAYIYYKYQYTPANKASATKYGCAVKYGWQAVKGITGCFGFYSRAEATFDAKLNGYHTNSLREVRNAKKSKKR